MHGKPDPLPEMGYRKPLHEHLATLGWLNHCDAPTFKYLEWLYFKFIQKCLTDDWYLIQGGFGGPATLLWCEIFMTLDIDRKAQADMMLLAHAGIVGRTSANHIMWLMLSDWALNEVHQNLSRKLSSYVKWQRRAFDRPPANAKDLWHFKWKNLDEPDRSMKKWSPLEVPRGTWYLKKDPEGMPLPPPECWTGTSYQ